MSLTRQSARTCLLWNRLGEEFREDRGKRLWRFFYETLRKLGEQAPPERTAGPPAQPPLLPPRQLLVRAFLEHVVELSDVPEKREWYEARLATERAPLKTLASWQRSRAASELFRGPLDRFAAAFYLAEISFVLGWLRVAKGYAMEASDLLGKAIQALREQGKEEPLALRILRFFTVTLFLEITFHTEGWGVLRDPQGMPQGRRIYAALTQPNLEYVTDFAHAADHQLLDQLARLRKPHIADAAQSNDPMLGFLRHHWLPIPNEEELETEEDLPDGVASGTFNPLALAFELWRKNCAGVFLFRIRAWKEAESVFRQALDLLEGAREEGPLANLLVPIQHETRLYLGRLKAQKCEFEHAETWISEALAFFAGIGDEFAANKARKYLAELKYRQFAWGEAEELFREVLSASREFGFDHDAASARLYLAKLLSRFGFQREALGYAEEAHQHFRQYDGFRETMECLFLQAAIHARRRNLSSHPAEDIARARAIVEIYRRFFDGLGVASQKPGAQEAWGTILSRLKDATRGERNPALLAVMLALRTSKMPAPEDLARLREDIEGGCDGDAWQIHIHSHLCRQVLRIVQLQQVQSRHATEEPPDRPELRKFRVRHHLVNALEHLIEQDAWDPFEICRYLHAADEECQKLGLRGGLVPFLVELAQFFVERSSYLASLLLCLKALDEVIELAPQPLGELHPAIDVEVLKRVYRSVTKYLVVERNLYLGPPPFGAGNTPELWQRLDRRQQDLGNWRRAHRQALLGGHGLWYPEHAVALGWVTEIDASAATLRLIWLSDNAGKPMDQWAVETMRVPLGVVHAGHASSPPAPILLVGRTGTLDRENRPDEGAQDWVAHQIPDLDTSLLFAEGDEDQPRPETWQMLFQHVLGQKPARFEAPDVDPARVEQLRGEFARFWFGNRLPEGLFKELFEDPATPSMPAVDRSPNRGGITAARPASPAIEARHRTEIGTPGGFPEAALPADPARPREDAQLDLEVATEFVEGFFAELCRGGYPGSGRAPASR